MHGCELRTAGENGLVAAWLLYLHTREKSYCDYMHYGLAIFRGLVSAEEVEEVFSSKCNRYYSPLTAQLMPGYEIQRISGELKITKRWLLWSLEQALRIVYGRN